MTIPLLYNENTYKQNLREMNANAGILRDLSMKLNQNRDETIQLETLLYKQIDEYNTYNTEKNDLQQRLLSLSQDIVTYLEWYILYGVFRTYLESSEQTIEMDTLLQFLGVETPILTSYEDIQDALLFWRNRDTDSTYLKQKLLSL